MHVCTYKYKKKSYEFYLNILKYSMIWNNFVCISATDVPTQQPLLYIQPTAAGQQGFVNFGGSFIQNVGHSQQQIINTNSQTAAMSAAAQGYTVMFNPQLTMQTPSQHASTSPYLFANQNTQPPIQTIAPKQSQPTAVLQQTPADMLPNQQLINTTGLDVNRK